MSRPAIRWRRPFSNYPDGAEHDPDAPYNQPFEPDACPMCGEPNTNADGSDILDGIYCSEQCAAQGEDDGAP